MNEKVFLITGGSSGIGLAISKMLVSQSSKVISLSRSKEKVQRALMQVPEIKGKVDFIFGDASSEEDMSKVSEYVDKNYAVLHGIVNNAAILNKGTIETMGIDDWKNLLDVNLSGPYIVTKKLLPLLKKANGASIVNISSVAGLKPGTSVAYSVSKAGLDMFTRFLAGDLGPYKIRANSVNPGLVRTNIHLDNEVVKDRETYEYMLEKSASRYPLGRVGEPEDIAEMVVFLLSEKSSWISGSIITVDGGIMVENDLIPPKK